ncbi:MAG: T9SS type A sorting domain-containing protein [Parafilimonas sp.]|nr:T9SS type A sorting domain-containing protein [Parafilimonas sp.]
MNFLKLTKNKLITVVFSVVLLCVVNDKKAAAQVTQTFTTSGTWVCPAGVTSATVECWGAGGSGATMTSNGSGAGGGGGAYSASTLSVIPGTTYSYTIGAGSSSTAAGGDTWFQSATTIMAKGGNSPASNSSSGAAGGAASAGYGTIKYSGGNGKSGNTIGTGYGGGGGSSAGSASDGVSATNQNGASAPLGGGDGGDGKYSTQGNGSNGSSPGGGGGGAIRTSTNTRTGGSGANGQIKITFTPQYQAQFISMNTGSSNWCPGETRTITVTVKNIGTATWTNSGPDVNIGVKWNADADYFVRTDANNLASGATQTYSLTVTAPGTAGTNNLTFDIVKEGDCWFGNNSGSCGPGNSAYTSSAQTIVALPGAPTGAASQSFCASSNPTVANLTATGTNIKWYSSSSGGTALSSSTALVNGSHYYASQTNASGCEGTARLNVTVTLTADATITLLSSAGTASQSVCINNSVTQIKYSIGGSGTGATITGLPTGVSGSYSAGVFTISGTPTVSGVYNYSVTTTGPCNNPSLSGTITVNANSTITLTSVLGTNVQTSCQNVAIADITYAIGGGGTGASVVGLPSGINGTYSSGVFTISGASLVAGTFNFTVTTIGPCTQATATGSITVNPAPTGTITASENSGNAINDNIICAGDNVTFTATSGFNYYNFKVNNVSKQAGTENIFYTSTLANGDRVTVDVANSSNCGTTLGPVIITVNPLPVPILTANKTTICAGGAVTFSTTASGTNYRFKVNGTPQQSGTSNTFITSSLSNGDSVTVEVANSNGCTGESAAQYIIVNALPAGNLTATTSTSGCPGTMIGFKATGGVQYQFKVNGVIVQAFSATNTYSSNTFSDGDVVTVDVTNASGCTTTYQGIAVNIKPLPSGTIAVTENSAVSNDNNICSGDPVTFTFSNPNYSNYNFKINGVSKQSSASNIFTTSALSNGDVVTIDVTNNNGCLVSFTAPAVSVFQLPAGTLTASATQICAGTQVTFSADAGFNDYKFRINGTIVQNGNSNVYTTSSLSNGDVITVLVKNSNGCTGTLNAITMVVYTKPSGKISVSPGTSACAGTPVTFTAPSGFSNYNFLLNGVLVQNGTSFTYKNSGLSNGDAISVVATNSGGCMAIIDTVIMTINALPSVKPIKGSLNICINNTTSLSDITPGGIWKSLNTNIVTIDATGTVTGIAVGTATITYTVTNANGCDSVASASVNVHAMPVVTPILGNQNICIGSTAQLSDATFGGTWSTSDATIVTIDNTGLITGLATGVATISYSVTNNNNCTTVVTADVHVHSIPVIPPISGVFTLCQNSTTVLSNTLSGGVWASSNTSIASVNASTGVVTGVSPGNSTITYTYTDTYGCSSYATQNITVNPIPSPTLTGPNPICLGDTDVYKTESGQFNYAWHVTNGTIIAGGGSSDDSIVIIWTNPGTKSISVNYTNTNGCAGATSATVANASGSSPVITGPNSVCQNSTGNIYRSPSGKIDYAWAVSSGGTITSGGSRTDSTITVTWNTAGTQTVTINYADPGGCNAASPTQFNVTVNSLPVIVINNPAAVCSPATVDLTAAAITAGSTPGLTFTYYTNAAATNVYSTPAAATAGTYYIKGTTASGCYDIKPVTVTVNPTPTVVIHNPAAVCSPATVDLTASAVTAGSTAGLTFTYYTNAGATNVYSTPTTATAGNYYIKGTTSSGCYVVKQVTVTVNSTPTVVINNPAAVCSPSTVDLTAAAITAGSTPGLTFTYYTNAAGTNVYGTPATASAGTYYIKGTNASGCYDIKAVTVTVNVSPAVIIHNPAAVCSPGTVNLTTSAITSGSTAGLTFTYFTDAAATNVYNTPTAATAGIYYIKGINASGCYDIKPVTVTVNPAPTLVIHTPAAVCSPGTVNLTAAAITSGSTSGLTFTYYRDAAATNVYSTPTAATAGTYYIKGTTASGCYDIKPVTVTVNPLPTATISGTASVCQNAASPVITFTGANGTSPYTFVYKINGGSNQTITSTGNTATINAPTGTTGTFAYTLVSVTDNSSSMCSQSISGQTATITVNVLPSAPLITPSSATICQNSIQPLIAGTQPTTGVVTLSNATHYTIPNNSLTGVSSTINVTGVPAGAVINSINITFNITEDDDQSLRINLTAPNGNILNLVNQKGGSGDNFTNTVVSSLGGSPFTTSASAAPFTGTYSADAGTSITAGTGSTSNTNSFANLLSTPNGNWIFSVRDGSFTGTAGTILTWTVTINYTISSTPTAVVWSPLTDLFTDAAATIGYTGTSMSTVYARPSNEGTVTYTATVSNAAGCNASQNVVLTVNPTPVVTIAADYCAVANRVQLTANSIPAATSYIWSTGETTQTILVDEAGDYSVTGYTAAGCSATAAISVANELVTNGSFESGDVGISTSYISHTGSYYSGTGSSGLWPEGYYAVDTSAYSPSNGIGYHPSFHGKDHTTGHGKFMMINGSTALKNVWHDTVAVVPNTTYYFSAWAMNLNPASPAQLQFAINGVQTGTIGDLNTAAKPSSESQVNTSNWIRFYGTWTAGPTVTNAVIGIVNLNTVAGGNDFGLDDISFGTLSPFIILESAPGTDAQTLCVNTQLTDIAYSVGNGNIAEPVVTGLPPGVTSAFSGNKMVISGIPTTAGMYTYTITTTGCNPNSATGTITVQRQKVTLSSGSSSPAVCVNTPVSLNFTLSGTATGGAVTGLSGATVTVLGTALTVNWTPNAAGSYPYKVISSGSGCTPDTATGTITVQSQTITLTSANSAQTLCVNSAINNIIYTIGGTATGATVTGLPPGVTGTYNSGLFVIKGTPTSATGSPYTYTVTTSGSCSPVTTTGIITVTPAATLTLTSAPGTDSQTVCKGSFITNIVYTLSNGTGATITGLPGSLTGVYSGGVFTISGKCTAAPGSYPYTITTSGGCTQTTVTGTIIIQTQTISLISGSAIQTICPNSSISNIVYSLGGTSSGATITGLPAGIISSLSNGKFTISGTVTDAPGTYPYTITTSGTSCTPATATGTIIISPAVNGGNLPALSICYGDGGSIVLSGQVGNVTKWEYSTDSGTTWLATSPANTSISQAYSNIISTVMYRATVNGCGTALSSTGSISIHNIWAGRISSDWNTGNNWSDNKVATLSCATIVIPAGTNYKPRLTSNVEVPNIDIAPTATLNLNGHTLKVDGAFTNTGTLIGSATSGLEINGTAGTVYFAADSASHILKTLTVNSGGSVTLGDSVNIVAGTNFGSVTSDGSLNANGYLTLKSDVNGTARVDQSLGTVTGNVTIERYIPPRRSWRFMNVPFSSSDQTLHDAWQEGVNNYGIDYNIFNKNPHPGYGTHITGNNYSNLGYDYNTTINPSIKVWDINLNGWSPSEPPTISTNIASFPAYCIFVRGSRAVNLSLATAAPTDPTVLRAHGILNETGSNIIQQYTVRANQFLFVGNPYASSINLLKVLGRLNASNNIASQKFWVWNPDDPGTLNVGGYVTYSNGIFVPFGSSYTAGAIIQGSQAFMLQAINDGTAKLNFVQNDKVSSETEVFGKAAFLPYPSFYINLMVHSGNTLALTDGVAAGFAKKFSPNVDNDDAAKLWNLDENVALIRNGTPLSIELRPLPVINDTLFLKLYLRQQPYVLQLFPQNFKGQPFRAWVIDRYLKTKMEISLSDTNLYAFSPNPDTNSYRNRFILVFQRQMNGTDIPVTKLFNQSDPNMSGITNSVAETPEELNLYPNPVSGEKVALEFKNTETGNYQVSIYNVNGEILSTQKIEILSKNTAHNLQLKPDWPNGAYLVSVINENSGKITNLQLVINR